MNQENQVNKLQFKVVFFVKISVLRLEVVQNGLALETSVTNRGAEGEWRTFNLCKGDQSLMESTKEWELKTPVHCKDLFTNHITFDFRILSSQPQLHLPNLLNNCQHILTNINFSLIPTGDRICNASCLARLCGTLMFSDPSTSSQQVSWLTTPLTLLAGLLPKCLTSLGCPKILGRFLGKRQWGWLLYP